MSIVNGGKLYVQGRCREVGFSWTESELKELYKDKTATVDEIRARYYPEQIKELKKEIKKVEEDPRTRKDLMDELDASGVEYSKQARKDDLIALLVD